MMLIIILFYEQCFSICGYNDASWMILTVNVVCTKWTCYECYSDASVNDACLEFFHQNCALYTVMDFSSVPMLA